MKKQELVSFSYKTLHFGDVKEKTFEIPKSSLTDATEAIISALCDMVSITSEAVIEMKRDK